MLIATATIYLGFIISANSAETVYLPIARLNPKTARPPQIIERAVSWSMKLSRKPATPPAIAKNESVYDR